MHNRRYMLGQMRDFNGGKQTLHRQDRHRPSMAEMDKEPLAFGFGCGRLVRKGVMGRLSFASDPLSNWRAKELAYPCFAVLGAFNM